MACDIEINKDGLLVLNGGDLSCVVDDDEIAQAVRLVLRTFRGEWFLNNTEGVDWFNKVFVKNPNLNDVQQEITDKVLLVDGVQSVIEYQQSLDTELRKLDVSFIVITTQGNQITIGESVP